jgi:hypothetical protein
MAEADPENTTPPAPEVIEKPEVIEAIQQPADAYGPSALSVDYKPKMEEEASSPAGKSAPLEKLRSWVGEQPFSIVEMAPLVLRYRTRRDLLMFGTGAVAGAGLLLPQATLSLVPVKLGLKNVKAITRITYCAEEPKDYWTQYGYPS